jgi:uncharacterized protein YajQ (UPF0234 family)
MPSFDLVCKTDLQLVDNAINTAKKELTNRYDLKDEMCGIDFDKKSDLGNQESYEDFLNLFHSIMEKAYKKLKTKEPK